MVELIANRDIKHDRLLKAMEEIPRHLFVPKKYRDKAYDDHALPIEEGQTISQPYIVAFMTNAIQPLEYQKVLEIGTGSGYQAAVLSKLVNQVYTIELIPELGESARKLLDRLGYENINFKIGDGYQGWKEHAPYDAIIVTAAPPSVPQALKEQLKVGGRMIIPVGRQGNVQYLKLLKKVSENRITSRDLLPVRFVPMKEGN